MKNILLGTVLLMASTGIASAQLPTQKLLSLKLAVEAATAAIEACQKDGYRVSATVVDISGQIRTQMRGDGAGFHTLESSSRKAITSATFRTPTSILQQRLGGNPAAADLRYVTGILLVAGGLPIMVGTETIGAIGVGGAPGGDKDEACSQAGIDKIKDSLK